MREQWGAVGSSGELERNRRDEMYNSDRGSFQLKAVWFKTDGSRFHQENQDPKCCIQQYCSFQWRSRGKGKIPKRYMQPFVVVHKRRIKIKIQTVPFG